MVAQNLPAVHGTPALRPVATHRKPIGHGVPADEAAGQNRPDGQVAPVGATAALEQKAPAKHGPDSAVRPWPAQKKPPVHATCTERPAAGHMWPVGHRIDAAAPAPQYEPAGHWMPTGETEPEGQ